MTGNIRFRRGFSAAWGVSLLSLFLFSSASGDLTLLYQKNGPTDRDYMGFSVAGAGDVNGDGKADFIIGASNAGPIACPSGCPGGGSVFVYSGANGALLYQKDGNTWVNRKGYVQSDNLGHSVAMAGDMNGDGKAEFIVGAYAVKVDTIESAGAAYVYSGATGALLYQKYGAAAYDFFGSVVASAGDVNGDGKADFIVGAPRSDLDSTKNGYACVYSGATGALLYQKNGAAVRDQFGWSVAGAGDLNGDGKADFLIGARWADPGGLTNAGSVFVYSGANGSLLYQKNGTAAYDVFGTSVAGLGDMDFDGKADFAVGASGTDPGGLNGAGSAFVYSGATGALLLQVNGIAAGDAMGWSVSRVGDLNVDDVPEIIVGAPFAA